MVFLGYGIALIAFYFWVKGNWFVPLAMLTVSAISIIGWGTLTWPSFFELAGICYAPIILRYIIRELATHLKEERRGRTFWRWIIEDLKTLGDPLPKPMARRQTAPAAVLTIEHRAQD